MPFYSNEIIQQLKAQADIATVIQQFVPIKKSGSGRFVSRCPFHDDHSPSMNINPTLGIYKCFACGAGGDVFKFVQEHEKIDFYGAIEWVANFVGFPLPSFAPENAELNEEKILVRQLNELACQWFEEQLSTSPKALEYLAKRRITKETRSQFRIGYAPDAREGFISFAAKKGFSPKQCVKAGLAVEKENGGISDKFRDRLMIAVQNLSGVIVAFGGRDLAPESTDFKRPKYMNSPETALYSKSDILYGLHHSRNYIAKENSVIIVEGYFDLLSLFKSGVKNVVAASGTALTESHASILSRYTKTAYLVFDGDAAGKKATLRSLEIVLPKGIGPRIFALSRPDGTKIDPDNFVNERGPEAFLEALKSADDWMIYLSREMPTASPEDRAAFVTYAKRLIKSIQNPELQNQYLKLLSERYNTDRSLARIESIQPKHRPTPPTTNKVNENADGAYADEYNGIPQEVPAVEVPWYALSPVEIRFANLLLRNSSLLDRAAEYFDISFAASGISIFESPLIDEFVQTLLAQYAETGISSPQSLYQMLSPELQLFMEGLPEESWLSPREIHEFYDTILVLTLRLCDRMKKNIDISTEEGMGKRLSLGAFAKDLQKLDRERKIEAITIDDFAEAIIQSKDKLLSLA